MTIYRLWALSLSDKSIIFTRYFPHLEKRDGFVFPAITAQDFIRALFNSLGISPTEQSSESSVVKESHLSLAPSKLDYDGNSLYKSKLHSNSSSSSSSLTSLNSMMSTATMATSISRQHSVDSTFPSELSTMSDHIALYNHLPLIICPFVSTSSAPRDSPMLNTSVLSSEDNTISSGSKKFVLANLILLVYEQNGYLFVACPRLVTRCGLVALNAEQCFDSEQLLLEEHHISLAYTELCLIASAFFSEAKSPRAFERFISAYMPFGTLIRTQANSPHVPVQSPSVQRGSQGQRDKEPIARIYLTESVSTSFRSSAKLKPKSSVETETIFGTLTVDYLPQGSTKSELVIAIDNLNQFTLTLPSNCFVANGTSLIVDHQHTNRSPFNVIHYLLNGRDENDQRSILHFEDQASPGVRRLFNYRYTIYPKSSSSHVTGQQQQVQSRNLYHVTLHFMFNPRVCLEDTRFHYFQVKFALAKRKSKQQVQTVGNSISNLIVRDSVRTSQGQAKNDKLLFVWVVGQRMPRSAKVTIEFDLLITEDLLQNLETHCNFRVDSRFANKLIAKNSENRDKLPEIKECKLTLPSSMIEPSLQISRLTVATESRPSRSQTDRVQMDKSNTILVEYRLQSFEYRLFPTITTHN